MFRGVTHLVRVEVGARTHVLVRITILIVLVVPFRRRGDDGGQRDRQNGARRRIFVLRVRWRVSEEIYIGARGETLWHPAQLRRQLAHFMHV